MSDKIKKLLSKFKMVKKSKLSNGTLFRNSIKIEKIHEEDYDRIFITSDIHGHYSLFQKLWGKIRPTKNDLLIILGDSCDRGPQSYELYKKYKNLSEEGYNIKHILGNHEDMLNKALKSGDNGLWYHNGGEETDISFFNNSGMTSEEWEKMGKIKSVEWFVNWLENLPLIIEGDKNIFVHAAYDTTKNIQKQEHRFLVWSRDDFWTGNKTGKAIYFGHTPSNDGKIRYYVNDVCCIDTGSYKTKILGCIELNSKEEIYVKN
ncbi:serine/threonine protein phosphatase [Leptotrichia sp. OH3620_COT-345]|uniref:metallophosphoesterase n=1 Tax=Leptotrichia sp. OH3620_COT-345 TaxID=2491048 RepID=UPI000F654F23|nr:metallophosphoesterase [Leptotrichia sp. OH3620_COT-345]RRD40643.1 serine/threonine protein phosphatase [Leptotrichia sp. OH3620_COT-345]